jgi:hypothetical protein
VESVQRSGSSLKRCPTPSSPVAGYSRSIGCSYLYTVDRTVIRLSLTLLVKIGGGSDPAQRRCGLLLELRVGVEVKEELRVLGVRGSSDGTAVNVAGATALLAVVEIWSIGFNMSFIVSRAMKRNGGRGAVN